MDWVRIPCEFQLTAVVCEGTMNGMAKIRLNRKISAKPDLTRFRVIMHAYHERWDVTRGRDRK